MKKSTTQSSYRAIRLVISTLLSSDLTTKELLDFAYSLRTDSSTSNLLSELLSSLSVRLRDCEPDNQTDSVEDIKARIRLIAEQQKYSGRHLWLVIKDIAPRLHRTITIRPLNLQRAIDVIEDCGGKSLLLEVLEKLISPTHDEYLNSIMNRSRKANE